MALKFSTGRGSRVKHATGADPKKIARARRRHPRLRYATGEDASIAHFTGRQFDYRKWGQDENGSGEGPHDRAEQHAEGLKPAP